MNHTKICVIILFYLNLIPSEGMLDFDYHSKGLGLFVLTPLFVHSFVVILVGEMGLVGSVLFLRDLRERERERERER